MYGESTGPAQTGVVNRKAILTAALTLMVAGCSAARDDGGQPTKPAVTAAPPPSAAPDDDVSLDAACRLVNDEVFRQSFAAAFAIGGDTRAQRCGQELGRATYASTG
jgi:hypothetical protein